MAWVRYDDQFHNNAKVTGVVAEDAGAIGLHTLANTWTNAQKHKGFVPAHQPGVLVCDKAVGPRWAELLVKYGLWHRVDDMCPACEEEYADLPDGLEGFVFHNAREYRAPERDRVTPGTSPELSEKRRAAGRKGGKASAKKRDELKQKQANQATAQASEVNGKHPEASASATNARAPQRPADPNTAAGAGTRPGETHPVEGDDQANGVSKASNLLGAGVSPVPVPVSKDASNEASAADEPRRTVEQQPNVEPTPLVLISNSETEPEPKPAKGSKRKKKNRTVQDDQADDLTKAFWERYSTTTAQSWIAIRQIVLGALNNNPDDPEQRDDVARALDLLGREGRAITQNTLTFALTEVRQRRSGLRPTGTSGAHQPYRNPEDQSEYDEDMF